MCNRVATYFMAGVLAALGRSTVALAMPHPAQAAAGVDSAANCSSCHPKYVQSMKDDTLMASKHAKAGVGDCSSCHDDDAFRKAHESPSQPRSIIRARRYPQEFCLRCHGSLEELAKKTANSKALTDVKGRVINPHDLPKTPAHKKAGECANCHRMHKKPMEPTEFCYGCHHKKEFACTECHADKKK